MVNEPVIVLAAVPSSRRQFDSEMPISKKAIKSPAKSVTSKSKTYSTTKFTHESRANSFNEPRSSACLVVIWCAGPRLWSQAQPFSSSASGSHLSIS